jgi:Ca2+-binding RTX toxin-like protein
MSDARRRPGRLVRLILLAALSAVVLAALPAAADAGRARVSAGRVIFDAFPGEANDVKVAQVGRTTVNVTDNGAVVTPGTGCVRVSDNLARCTVRNPGGIVRLGDGDDHALSRIATLFGEDGNDRLEQIARPTVSLPGNVAAGAALANGGAGDDTITGNDVNGGDGNDTITPSVAESFATLFGGPGDDSVRGTSSADVLAGGTGTDHIVTGGGPDTLSFQDQAGPVVFSTQAGGLDPDTYEGSFVSVIGASSQDQLTGDDADNTLVLGGGTADGGLLSGAGGNDVLNGSQGRERILGGAGDDRLSEGDLNGHVSELDGGEGGDWLNVADVAEEDSATDELELAPTADVFTCGAGLDEAVVDSADAVPSDCEVVARRTPTRTTTTGTNDANVIAGFSGDGDEDTIFGLGGDDLLTGLNGDDLIYGQDGKDNLVGDGEPSQFRADGKDRLSGGDGNDLIAGGGGSDRLTGGAGADNLSGSTGNDVVNARDGRRDRVSCGSGRDRVSADRADTVSRDCESVSRR